MTDVKTTKLAADVGGTFTDVVLQSGEKLWTAKVLTTPSAPEEGVIRGITSVLEASGIGIGEIGTFVHGTTLATNAIIERNGARTALLVTAGFRDILDIGTESRYDQYELALDRPAPLVSRPLRYSVSERMDARGNALLPLDEAYLHTLVGILRDDGIESLAIAFLHSYANPAHEQRAAEILRAALPKLHISLSCEVCPEIREYERTSTTVANAYVQPLMDGYLARMDLHLKQMGFTGLLCLMTSGGGLTSVDTARAFPVRLVESGPAGGAIFASRIAAQLGEKQVIAFDMGGTTAKISLIENFRSENSRVFEVDRSARFLKGSGLPLRIPVIEMVEIGAGGGSLARVDTLSRVTVGPESASSVPGPACYGAGGTHPAVTDADVALGIIDPDDFAGGEIRLRPDLSRATLGTHVGLPLGLDPEMAAYAVYEVVCENMASAARAHTVEKGQVAGEHTMIAFGGAAPLHVARVAEKIGSARVIIPPNAGVGSAIGFLAAPVSYEIVRTKYLRLDAFDPAEASRIVNELSADVRSWVEPAAGGEPVTEERLAFMRYVGQGHEISIALPLRDFTAEDVQPLRVAYEEAYQRLFSRSIPNADIEIIAWSVSCATPTKYPATAPTIAVASGEVPGQLTRIFDGRAGQQVDVRRYARASLRPGILIEGPALIVEQATTTYVTASFNFWIDAVGSIVMDRKKEAA